MAGAGKGVGRILVSLIRARYKNIRINNIGYVQLYATAAAAVIIVRPPLPPEPNPTQAS